MSGTIKLRIPHQRPYHGIARLVVGGLAARLDLSYEHLEDLQLALGSVLEDGAYARQSQVTVELEVGEDTLVMLVGPLYGEKLQADLDDEGSDGIGLGRLLGTLVDAVRIDSREDGEWLRLQKSVRLLHPEGSRGRA